MSDTDTQHDLVMLMEIIRDVNARDNFVVCMQGTCKECKGVTPTISYTFCDDCLEKKVSSNVLALKEITG